MNKPKTKCGDCGWKDNTDFGVDKCPNCRSDNWVKIKKKTKK